MSKPIIDNGTGRKVAEWIGKSPDSMPPDRVRLRIFRRYGARCHITGREIRPGDPWDCDHIVALCNGGENRESNLAPALKAKDAHKAKTAADVALKAKNDARAKAYAGIKDAPRRKIQSRGFQKSGKRRESRPLLPPSRLYRDAV